MPTIAEWDREIRTLNIDALQKYLYCIYTLRDWSFFSDSFNSASMATLALLIEHRLEQLKLDAELDRFFAESGAEHGIDGSKRRA